MIRSLKILVVSACFAALFLTCYAPVLFGDRQFGYRDAAHYYYPLYQRVKHEWDAGRWPLWEPEENAGMPLLGNPTAAVLYPGKLVFAILPYAWGARVYVMMHTGLAFAAMLILMRSWQTSWVGSTLAALSYAFGMPILFQYSNIVYLVGAAWLPLGICAADRWVRSGRRRGLVELAIVLAMQMLGGDLQSAYLLGGAAGGYAAGIAWSRAREGRRAPRETFDSRPAGLRPWRSILLTAIGMTVWVAATLALAKWLPRVRPPGYPPPPLPWMPWVSPGVVTAWAMAGLGSLAYGLRRGWRSPLVITWLGLALSAGLAIALAAAQLLPAIEFVVQTARAAGPGRLDIYRFSIEPFRLVELAWPNILGLRFEGNTYWPDAVKLPGVRAEIWVPSLYLGGLTLVLACGALAMRQGPPWRVWLSALAVVSLLGSLGPYTSPLWAARALAETSGLRPTRDLVQAVGPLDPVHTTPVRIDRFLRDGDGGIYWWLATALPGFQQVRYPAKLYTFTAMGIAALAGLGWDGLRAGRTARIAALFASILVASIAALAVIGIERPAIVAALRSPVVPSMYGPLDAGGGFRAMLRGLVQASIVSCLGLAMVRLVRTRPRWAGAIALSVTTADLAAANARYVLTVSQAVLEAKPEVLRLIEEAERKRPSAGPFRIHRMPAWHPPIWQATPSVDRAGDYVAWEHDTLQPKYGINHGTEYTHTFGVGQLYDYDWFFDGFPRAIRTPEGAKALGVEIGQEVMSFPRRSFDIWNTRYFVVPAYPPNWRDPYRGYASFVFETERVYPGPGTLRGPNGAETSRSWMEKDFQIRRNLNELPRAWVVHAARWLNASASLSLDARNRSMLEMIYADDPIWHDARMSTFDPRAFTWVDRVHETELAPYLSGSPPRATETVKVTYPTPQRAELEVSLESPGLVILADVYYPGWELTIDGKPAPIYRVNRLMRGAAVPPGTHHLVYSYAPQSFRIGAVLSILGLGALGVLGVACALRPVDPVVRTLVEHASSSGSIC